MWSQSGSRLTLALAIVFASACGEKSPDVDEEVEEVRNDEEDASTEEEVDASEEPEETMTGVRDTGPKPPPPKDSGPSQPAPTDAGTPKPTDGGPVADTGAPKPTDGGTDPGPVIPGECCEPGETCLCHGPAPTALTNMRGPYATKSYSIAGTGCVYYPDDPEAKGPFAAVAISDGFLGAGGCGRTQTDGWGPLYASWGIVAMIVETGASDQPNMRGAALTEGIAAFKSENTKSGSPLNGKLAGRYGTSGFSMGGGGTSFASQRDPSLLTSVAIMPWGPVRQSIKVPTLVICGSSDGTAPCSQHGTPLYNTVDANTPKMRVTVQSGHAGQPTAGGGRSGQYGLAFQKVFLENDTRWRKLLVGAQSDATTIK